MSNDNRTADTAEESGLRSRVSRRTVLRTGVNTGIAAGFVWGLGAANYATNADLGSITYALARPDPDADTLEERTKDVPVAWHESLRLAFDAQAAIQETGLEPLVSSFVVPGSYDSPQASVSVQTTDETVQSTLESIVEFPFDITVLEEIPPQPQSDGEYESAYQLAEHDPEHIPGGVRCDTDSGSGTLTPAMFDAETGERYFATSNHVYDEEGTLEDEHRSEPLFLTHNDTEYQIGQVAQGYPLADIVRVEPVDGYQPVSEIERAEPSQVTGQYTRLGLADLMARDGTLEKLGAISDRTSGEIKGVNAMTCYSGAVCKPGQLIWGDEDALTDGDSGSVNFHPDPENPDDSILVGGINNARTWWPSSDFTWGTAAHHLLEEYGLHF
ncbi:hypothetical protein [Natronolimnobius baerhuensis]|uniref:Uncharacterized protein n=1 Tax=Natronolimnobius baerhuensis TaxID=253108 RepID=A0A202E6D0_9EURY|nr:hypothetical protein [Natronolimnobius baerhuensis]OVE83744.1 hypothetical protein B2G88_15085 [Natronolimnobius baerhuensis]